MKNWPAYHLGFARHAKTRANCLKRAVGAVMVRDNRIIATGYNGTPSGLANCLDGGCYRCSHPDAFPAGQGYDQCVCVHAEANLLLQCARFGISCDGAAVYSTLQPCFTCLKEMFQAGLRAVYFESEWDTSTALDAYRYIAERFETYAQLNESGTVVGVLASHQ